VSRSAIAFRAHRVRTHVVSKYNGRKSGVDSTTSFDHTDVRPTILAPLGLQDLYVHEGACAANKEINAPFGDLSMNALKVSTAAFKSADANDATYTRLSAQIASWTSQRDGLASEMKSMLNAAAFENAAIDHRSASFLIDKTNDLLKDVERAAKLLK